MEDVALFFRLLGAFSFVAGTVVAGDQYVIVWKTDRAWAGTCRDIVVDLVDVRGTRPLVLAPWDGCDSVDGDTCTVRIKAGLNFVTTGAYAP